MGENLADQLERLQKPQLQTLHEENVDLRAQLEAVTRERDRAVGAKRTLLGENLALARVFAVARRAVLELCDVGDLTPETCALLSQAVGDVGAPLTADEAERVRRLEAVAVVVLKYRDAIHAYLTPHTNDEIDAALAALNAEPGEGA